MYPTTTVVVQIVAKIEMTQNKNRLFGRHFETVQHLFFSPGIMAFDSAYIYGANVIENSGGKVVFLGGFHGPPGH